jgi:hypothetical protein
MKVGLIAVVFGRVKGKAVMKSFATNAERLGFSTLWAPEHVVLVGTRRRWRRYSRRGPGTGAIGPRGPASRDFNAKFKIVGLRRVELTSTRRSGALSTRRLFAI